MQALASQANPFKLFKNQLLLKWERSRALGLKGILGLLLHTSFQEIKPMPTDSSNCQDIPAKFGQLVTSRFKFSNLRLNWRISPLYYI